MRRREQGSGQKHRYLLAKSQKPVRVMRDFLALSYASNAAVGKQIKLLVSMASHKRLLRRGPPQTIPKTGSYMWLSKKTCQLHRVDCNQVNSFPH